MRISILLFTFFVFYCSANAQVYIEKKSRHRFAQLNLGIDFLTSFGGESKYIDKSGSIQSIHLENSFSPRFLIGGTHFWGHADFYIGIPFTSSSTEQNNQKLNFQRGVETVFKFYPWRIQHSKIRPFIGFSIATMLFKHNNYNLIYPIGPELNQVNFPLHSGFTFNLKNHLFELGASWNYAHKHSYSISRTQMETINTPPFFLSFSYRYMLETTLSAEKNWESGRTKEVTKILAERGRLNGFFLGAGISSAFWLKQSEYNASVRPYKGINAISTMPDFTIGYYLHKPDLNIAIGYRAYGASSNAYGSFQKLNRNSLLIEASKYLLDYHGFAPFVGPNLSFENLSFSENHEGIQTINANENKLAYGFTFGWDIRPNRIQSWILRTNLSWYPNLFLEVENNKKVFFNNLEFNFIQLIVYPNRMMKPKKSKAESAKP
jgi:hypothetical protein